MIYTIEQYHIVREETEYFEYRAMNSDGKWVGGHITSPLPKIHEEGITKIREKLVVGDTVYQAVKRMMLWEQTGLPDSFLTDSDITTTEHGKENTK